MSEKGIAQPLPQSSKDLQFFDIGTKDYAQVAGSDIEQRTALVRAIQEKERTSDYKTAFKALIEEVAYTWFNRLIAIRFMEVNEYLLLTIVFVGSGYEKTTLKYGTQPGSNGGEQGSCYSFEGANVTFKDVTLQDVNGDDVDYKGFVRSNGLTFENCLLKSRMTNLGENGTVSFKNCTFNTPKYAAWIYSSQTYNFNNCLFESKTGRFLNIYNENNIQPVINATECRFIDTSNGTDSNAVFNIKPTAKTKLTITDCVVTGASPLYKVGSDNGTTVTVDGKTVYGNAN